MTGQACYCDPDDRCANCGDDHVCGGTSGRWGYCPDCWNDRTRCSRCGGSGVIDVGQGATDAGDCPACDGSGT